MKTIELNDRDVQMLELLARGGSSRELADSLGYREGTMRVYLHGLYRKIGVPNKTSAVIWYFDRLKAQDAATQEPEGRPAGAVAEETFGDVALRTDLRAALGAMGMFLGAYGRVWQVGARLKGTVIDAKVDHRRRQSRALWEAFLAGDFVVGKQLHDDDGASRLLVDSPADCVILGCLLAAGGYTRATDRVIALLAKRKKGSLGVSAREMNLVRALRDAVDKPGDAAATALYGLAVDKGATPVLRQAAMVSLYWAYRARHDVDRARATANALFAEAESQRQSLQAMGEKPLYRESAVPRPGSAAPKGAATRTAKARARVAVAAR